MGKPLKIVVVPIKFTYRKMDLGKEFSRDIIMYAVHLVLIKLFSRILKILWAEVKLEFLLIKSKQ